MFKWIERYRSQVRDLEAKVERLEGHNHWLRTMLNDARDDKEEFEREITRRNTLIANRNAAIAKRDRKIEALVQFYAGEDFIL